MSDPVTSYSLSGRLIASESGWLLLEVPNAVVQGLFAALDEPGVELPPSGPEGRLRAHISVMRKEEVDKLGGPQRVTERGKMFHYSLGRFQEIEPAGWSEMSRAWIVEILSPELKALRRSYGLSPVPQYPYHLTVAVRRRGVLRDGPVSKATMAPDEEGVTSLKMSAAPLDQLLAAKGLSDRGDMKGKLAIMQKLVQERPDEFELDTDVYRPYPGIRHKPTNFRMHLPRRAVMHLHQTKVADLLPEVQLQPHQKRIQETGAEEGRKLLLYHQLGSGKSLSGISAAERRGQPYTVITPASLRPNFNKELNKFTDHTVPSQVMSYEQMAKGAPVSQDTVIFDEAQRMRNPSSQSSQVGQEVARRARNLYLLSGTPIVNHPSDLVPLLSMLTSKQLSPDEFNAKFVKEKKVWPGFINWLRGIPRGVIEVPQHEQELRKALEGHVDFHGAAELPVETEEEEHRVELQPEQAALYRGFWKNIPWYTRWKMRRDFPMSRDELAKMTSFLSGPRQVGLSTLPFRSDKDPVKAFEQSAKLQKAMELLKTEFGQNPNSKAVIFSNFIDAGLKPYAAGLEQAGIPAAIFHGGLNDTERKKIVDQYNSGQLKALLLGPSGSEGLSLRGTRLMQLLDPHWQETRLRQAIGRGVRYDSHGHLPPEERKVRVQRLMAAYPRTLWQRFRGEQLHDVDDYLQSMARQKQELNDRFLKILQEVGTKQASEERLDKLWLCQEFEYQFLTAAGEAPHVKLADAKPDWDAHELEEPEEPRPQKWPAHYDEVAAVRPSSIQGRGTFALRAYEAGETIGPALILLPDEFNPGVREYLRTTVGRFVNHADGEQANTTLVQNGDNWDLVAEKQLQPGEEMTADYIEANEMLRAVDARPHEFHYAGHLRGPHYVPEEDDEGVAHGNAVKETASEPETK